MTIQKMIRKKSTTLNHTESNTRRPVADDVRDDLIINFSTERPELSSRIMILEGNWFNSKK
jgi:hypothetical protein